MVEVTTFPVRYGNILMIKINSIIDDRYKIIANIASGGMSNVFEARDIIFKRNVAIKILKSEFRDNLENLIRFQNEAKISASLNHPNIVKIYDYGEVDDLPYIVNEFIKEQTLREVLDYKRYLSLNEACSIIIQVLDAISYLHSKQIIHRDIKPLNIFILNDGGVKITDFGISFVKGSSLNLNETKKIMGTAQYLAPELIKGLKPSFQTDIYAIGIVFYEILTGKVPFDSKNPSEVAKMQLKNIVPSVLKTIPNLPNDVDEIIRKATDKNIFNRYKTCEDFKNDLSALLKNKKLLSKSRGIFKRLFGLLND